MFAGCGFVMVFFILCVSAENVCSHGTCPSSFVQSKTVETKTQDVLFHTEKSDEEQKVHYLELPYGKASCPASYEHVDTWEACQKAVEALGIWEQGKEYWKGTCTELPRYCSIAKEGTLVFETGSGGKGRSDLATICKACLIEENTDYSDGFRGRDKLYSIPHVASAQKCAELCGKIAACKSWTYHKKPGYMKPKKCVLKSKAKPDTKKSNCCDSGLPCKVPTLEPTPEPTPVPTLEPTPEPTPVPTLEPTPEPTPVVHLPYIKKYVGKWPNCVNGDCITGSRKQLEIKCNEENECTGFSFSEEKGAGCVKQCGPNEFGGYGFGPYDYWAKPALL